MADISEELRAEIIRAIEAETIPEKDFHFREDFSYMGRTYMALGTLKYKEKTYEFIWNHDEGIFYESIEENEID